MNEWDELFTPLMIPKMTVGEFDEDKILQSVFSAIALNKKLDTYINKKFSTKSAKYSSAAYAHEWYPFIVNSMCLADQIERGIKVLGIWVVDGIKALDDIIKQGWPKAWRTFEQFYKDGGPERIKTLLSDTMEDEDHIYDCRYFPDIMLYYLYYHGFKDLPFPLNPEENLFVQEALFFTKGRIDPINKEFDPMVEKFFENAGLENIFTNFKQLDDQLEEDADKEIMLFKVSLNFSGLNYFCLLENGLTKKEADTVAVNEMLTIGTNNDHSDILYYGSYIISLLCKEYVMLKEKYFKAIKKHDLKSIKHDEKTAKKELKKAQTLTEKLQAENKQFSEKLTNAENQKRKIEAERDSIITKAAKEQEKSFASKEKKYRDRIALLEEMLADLNEESVEAVEQESFEEMLDVVKNTTGILFVCKEESSAAISKLRRLREIADNIKFYTSENDAVPLDISYIFFDFHLINHGIYWKVKNIGKRYNIPIYNIQDIKADNNIVEMYNVIKKNRA